MPLSVGAKLGPYEILAPIGAGGMGEVFRATDTRLHRTVAIKILPHDKVADPDRKRRFLQEARAASALNHPNIVTVHDIASDNGVDYLVMEYVPGNSLDKLIAPKGLPFAEVVAYATQIGNALASAHAAGIVHRDIKPANTIVTAEGRVKVLDFGLAKLDEPAPSPDDETRTMVTEAGMVMGTMAYMSPEQARAEAVDARTDLFSFGAVLFEMATGRRAFLKAWDWTTPPVEAVPPELRRIVLKLLQVNRELRYQTAADVVTDLKLVQRGMDGKHARRRWMAAAAGLVALAIGLAAILYLRPNRSPGRDQWVQLTKFPDSVSQPALSADGRMLTFIRGPDTYSAPGQIYIKMLPDGEPVQLTHDDVNKMSPGFSPDGSRISYTVNTPGKWDTWVVPVVSGAPRLWLGNASGLLWLDKRRVLFSEMKQDGKMGIVTAEEDRSGARDVYLPAKEVGMAHRSYPSPDGKSALVVEMMNGENGVWAPCRLVSTDASAADHPVGPPSARCSFAAWSRDGKWMYFSSSADGTYHTWREPYPEGPLEQITSGPTEEEGIAMDPDGRSFITSVGLRQSVVSVHDATGDRQISLEGYSYDAKFTPDGKKLCYRILKTNMPTAFAGYPSELHLVELDTGHNQLLLPGLTVIGQPGLSYSISPDRPELVANVKDEKGKVSFWLVALDGQSPPRQIPNAEGRTPYFGKDGEIFFRGPGAASAFAYRVHEDGMGLRKLSEEPIQGLHGISLDGQWVIAKVHQEGRDSFRALPVKGGVSVPTVPAEVASWSPDGGLIYISVPTAPLQSVQLGRTYVVPLTRGQMFPSIPAGGFKSVADLAKLPGARVIDDFNVSPGPTPEVYAFSKAIVLRNLYRVPIQ